MSALIIRTLHIVRGLQRILFFCFNHYIDYNDTVDPCSFILQTCFSSQIIFSRAFCFSHLQWVISNLLLRFCALHVFLFPLKVQDCNKISPYWHFSCDNLFLVDVVLPPDTACRRIWSWSYEAFDWSNCFWKGINSNHIKKNENCHKLLLKYNAGIFHCF